MSVGGLAVGLLRVSVLLAVVALTLSLFKEAPLDLMAQDGGRPAGTAFVVQSDGYLLTAAHVVKDAVKIDVAIGGKTYDATVLGVDEKRDLALVRIKAKGLPALPLGNSNAVEVGEEVCAFGFPLASALGDSVKVTRGTVSGIETKAAQRVLQIDAAVNPGNSGGPLLNERGEVVGVINAKLVGAVISNVGFAILINYAKPLLFNEGVKFGTQGAKVPLGGAVLVKRTSAAVALVIVPPKSPPTPMLAGAPPSPELVRMLTGHSGTVWSIGFSSDGETVASASSDNTVRLWDTKTGALLHLLLYSMPVTSVAFSPDGKNAASAASDLKSRGEVVLWLAKTGKFQRTLAQYKGPIYALAFSPDGLTLASGSYDKTVRLWDAHRGRLKAILVEHTDLVRSVAFSSDGKALASAGYDKTVRLWHTQTGGLKSTLTGHGNDMNVVAFSRDGKTLASGSYQEIRLWDLETETVKRTLAGHNGWVESVAFSPDGKLVGSGGEDSIVRLWDVSK